MISCATGSNVRHVIRSDVITGSMFCACPAFTRVFSYYSSTKCSTAVQVPGLPEVTEGHVTPKGFHLGEVCACATGSGAIFVLVETESDVIKRLVASKGFHWKGGVRACTTRCYSISDETLPVVLPLENIGARMHDRKYTWCAL